MVKQTWALSSLLLGRGRVKKEREVTFAEAIFSSKIEKKINNGAATLS